MKHFLTIIFISVLFWAQSFAQTESPNNLPVDQPDNIDFSLTRSFLLTTNELDSVPLNAGSSGTIGLGLSFKVHLPGNTVGLRFHPGISWTRFTYEQIGTKVFPTRDTTKKSEKHRLTFVDLGLGIFVNLSKDEDGNSRFYLEAGGYLGRRTSGIYKIRYEKEGSSPDVILEVKERTRGVESLEDWRYGLYGRIGYKWAALYYSYRLSEVFTANPLDANGNPSNFERLGMPPMELGITIFL